MRREVWRAAYRLLLPLMPHGLRSRQGDAMLELFDRELLRSEPDGARAVWVAGLTGLADLARRGVYERVAEERRALTPTNLAILRHTAFTFVVASAVLTALFVAKATVTRAAAPLSGTVLDVMLLSIPYTAALTIPMAVFIAVLWAASRRPTVMRREKHSVAPASLRLAPVIGLASVVALCCLVLNAELVPRANLRLQALFAGEIAVAPSERSMTLRELRQAEAKLVSASRAGGTTDTDGASVAGYEVEVQKKFALAAACLLLALLAAAIGTRAGRIPLLAQAAISVVVFAGYYVCIIVGEHLVDRSVIPAALAMWSGNSIVLVAAALTHRVSRARRREAVHVSTQSI